MTASEKRLALRTGILGLLLTCLALAGDWAGLLQPLDNWLYDQRTRHCQFFAPPPTDDLVYVDIDDQSIDAVGVFPWPRQTLADIVDEIHRAGAKVLAFDTLFTDLSQQEPQVTRDDSGKEVFAGRIDHDARLAEACKRFGKVLIPASFTLDPAPKSPTYLGVRDALVEDLEQSQEQLVQRVRGKGEADAQLQAAVQHVFPEALREAMYLRVAKAAGATTQASVDNLRGRLLPHTSPAIVESYLLRLLATELERYRASELFPRFARKPDASLPPLLVARNVFAPISVLAAAGTTTGYVDYLPSEDGVVRSTPLFISYRGGVYPQAGLSLACAMLDIDPADPARVRISADAVTLLPANRAAIILPVHPARSQRLKALANTFFNIPWYGDRDWVDMYGRFHKNPHLLVNDIWQLCQSRRALINNNRSADDAIKRLLVNLTDKDDKRRAFMDHPLPPEDYASRAKFASGLIEEMRQFGYLQEYEGKKPSDYADEKNQLTVAALLAWRQMEAQTPRLLEMISRQEAFLHSRLNGRAALIGYVATAAAASDFVPTSLHARCPGMIVHGAIFNGIMTGELWKPLPDWLNRGITLIIGLLTTLAVTFLSPWKAVAATLAILIGWLAFNGIVLFDYLNLSANSAGAGVVAATGLVFAGGTATRLLLEGIERMRITSRFRSYVDDALVDYVLAHPEKVRFDGETRNVTVCFTDLAGFTELSERLGERIVRVLNQYFGLMMPIIRGHGGYVNKFIGDGIMFVFNAPIDDPNHAKSAIAAICEMQATLKEFSDKLQEQGLPRLRMRGGISTSEAVVGDAGPTERSDYTVLGDSVNLAARLESANKVTGTSTLLTQETAEALGADFFLRPVAPLQVVGKQEVVMTYEALGACDGVTDAQRQLAAVTAKVIDAFRGRRFADCIAAAEELARLFPEEKLPALYRKTCEAYLADPPTEPFTPRIVLLEK